MQVQPVAFTGSGIIGAAGFTGETVSPETGAEFDPTVGGVGDVAVPQQAQYVVGFSFTGFTAVTLYNGSDNTGDVVAKSTTAGTTSWNYEVNCNRGLYVEVAGTGKGTVWLA